MLQETTIQNSTSNKDVALEEKKTLDKKEELVILSNLSDYKIFETEKPQEDFYNIYTVSVIHVPEWYGHSEFIVKGYRRITNSYLGATKSLLYLHNETGNILTHGLGALLFIIVAIWFYTSVSNYYSWKDPLVMVCFFIGAIGILWKYNSRLLVTIDFFSFVLLSF